MPPLFFASTKNLLEALLMGASYFLVKILAEVPCLFYYRDMRTKKYTQPKRFLEVRQRLKFATDAAKARFIKMVENCGDEGIDLNALMIGINEEAEIKFPEESEILILGRNIDNAEMEDLDRFLGAEKISLNVQTDIDDWVMNRLTGEPERVSEVDDLSS